MDILAAYALALASSGMLWKGKKMDLQKEVDAFIQKPAYGLSHAEKSVRYAKMLSAATQYHREKCPEYGRFSRALEDTARRARGQIDEKNTTQSFLQKGFLRTKFENTGSVSVERKS